MARLAARAELDGADALLGDLDGVVRGARAGSPERALGEQELAADGVELMPSEPLRSVDAADLFVCASKDAQRTAQRHVLTLERNGAKHGHHAEALHIERAAPVDEAVAQQATERIDGPVIAHGGYDVHVMRKHERVIAGAERCDDVRLVAGRAGARGGEALGLEELLDPIGGLRDVAGRVRRVDRDVVPQQLDCFLSERRDVDIGGGLRGGHELSHLTRRTTGAGQGQGSGRCARLLCCQRMKRNRRAPRLSLLGAAVRR